MNCFRSVAALSVLLLLSVAPATALLAADGPGGAAPDPEGPAAPDGMQRFWAAREAVLERLAHLVDPPSEAAGNETPLAGELVDLHGWSPGDADGDGRDDVVLAYTRLHVEETSIEWRPGAAMLAGPDLERVFWNSSDAGFHYPLADHDGDGVQEIGHLDAAFSYDADHTGAAVVSQSDFEYTLEGDDSFLQAGDRSVLGRFPHRVHMQGSQAGASPVAAWASAGASQGEARWVMQTGPGGLAAIHHESTQATAYGATPAGGAFAYAWDDDLTITLLDLDGAEEGRLEILGATSAPASAIPVDLDGDGRGGVAAAWLEGTPHAYASPAWAPPMGKGHVEALGRDGTRWSHELAGDLVTDVLLLPLPDLDGDGHAEVEAITIAMAPQSPDLIEVATIVLSGADGSVLHSRSQGLTAYLPFGDVSGDGAPELVRIALQDLAGYDLEWSVVDRSFEALWTLEATAAWSLNVAFDPVTWSTGFADWSGDGAPDLAFASLSDREEPGGIDLTLHDGTDGAVLYATFVAGDAFYAVSDLSGRGGGDLVAVYDDFGAGDGESDFANGTLGFRTVAGESGQTLWTQVLRSPGTTRLDTDEGAYARPFDIGDLDGDGRSDLLVVVREAQYREGEGEGWAFALWYYRNTGYLFLSGQPDRPVAVAVDDEDDGTGSAQPALRVDGEAGLPASEAGAAGLDAQTDDVDTPWSAWTLLAGVAAAVLLARRR